MAEGIDMASSKAPYHGLLKPDLILLMDVPIESASKRGGYGDEYYDRDEVQRKVLAAYEALKDDTWAVNIEKKGASGCPANC